MKNGSSPHLLDTVLTTLPPLLMVFFRTPKDLTTLCPNELFLLAVGQEEVVLLLGEPMLPGVVLPNEVGGPGAGGAAPEGLG